MNLAEIILIVLGILLLVLSYVLPAGKGKSGAEAGVKIDESLMRGLVEKAVGEEKRHINDMVEETLSYSMEKTERAMERLTNEKIQAINEYSDQVLESIHKSHQEVIFLYDMLNDKHDKFVHAVSEATKKVKDIRQEVRDIEIMVKEAVAASPAVMPMAEEREKKDIKEGWEKGQETAAEKAAGPGEESGFIPIAPQKAEDLSRLVREAKENTEDGEAVFREEELAKKDVQGYNNNERILRMHKLGMSKTAIARELGLGVGEVKLVIDLFEQA